MTDLIRIEPHRFIAGGGKFDSTRRYLRRAPAGVGTPIAQGRTFTFYTSAVSGQSFTQSVFRWALNGVVKQQTSYDGGAAGAYALTTASTWTADCEIVKKIT
ncbi:hypothetical protein [Rhodomicrobium lacus]|uniref:hypothetical protein n=1 Tax=Rhodomicrobium lacus TaxID=2498452 RepID=UPI000F8CD964|nr:hypothetical protein [Rhodomicrobium lacus]